MHTCEEINSFERTLTDDGNVLIKFFLYISQKEQRKRFDKMLGSKETAWKVSRQDEKRNRNYRRYKSINEEMLEKTETACAPWVIVEAENRRFATVKIYTEVIRRLEEAVRAKKKEEEKNTKTDDGAPSVLPECSLVSSVLSKVDLSLSYTEKEYKQKLKKLQSRIELLHSEIYRRRIPVVLGFEGWDAAGKGGAIKRLTEPMDPRGYVVNPTAAPSDLEKSHHYLWRFWRNMPKAGHIAILTEPGTAELW